MSMAPDATNERLSRVKARFFSAFGGLIDLFLANFSVSRFVDRYFVVQLVGGFLVLVMIDFSHLLQSSSMDFSWLLSS